jgi:hypothetical protein
MQDITDIVNVKLLSNYQDGVRAFDLEKSMNTLTPAQRQQLQGLVECHFPLLHLLGVMEASLFRGIV